MPDKNLEAYGKRNPDAPEALSHFSFLIGKWRGEGNSKREDGTHDPYRVTWVRRYILDGCAIADEAFVHGRDGAWEAIFITYRFFNSDQNRWIIEVRNVLAATWFTQAPEDLGGVQVGEKSISWKTRGPNVIGRETFFTSQRTTLLTVKTSHSMKV